jgi:hypothetical protein
MTKVEISINYPEGYCSQGNMVSTMVASGHELTISEVLNMMTHCLRGVGYCFDGEVSIVPTEEELYESSAAASDGKVNKSEERRRKYNSKG